MRAVSEEDACLIGRLVARLERELPKHFDEGNRASTIVRLFDVHTEVPLQLELMLTYRLEDVAHDMGLILHKWDAVGKKFTDMAWPRFAKEQ